MDTRVSRSGKGREGKSRGGGAPRRREGSGPPRAASASGPQPAGWAAAAPRRPAGACLRSGYALSARSAGQAAGRPRARAAGSGCLLWARRVLGMSARLLPDCLGPLLYQESDNLARALPDRQKPDRTLTRAQSPRSPAHSRPARELPGASPRRLALEGRGRTAWGRHRHAGPGRGPLANATRTHPRRPFSGLGLLR